MLELCNKLYFIEFPKQAVHSSGLEYEIFSINLLRIFQL